jgi:hypothetical protein
MVTAVLSLFITLPSFGQESGEIIGVNEAYQVNNHAYLNPYWFSGIETLTDQQMKDRVLELQSYKIKNQLADIGVVVSGSGSLNGTLPKQGYKELGRWMKISRETDPNQKIIVSISDGKRVIWRNGKKIGNPNFGNAVYNNNLRAIADQFVNQGIVYNGNTYKADGIQFDIEGFLSDDPLLKATSQFVRGVLNEDAIYSIAAPTDPRVWSDAYISGMSDIFNMLSPMMYDQLGYGSPINSPETYQQFWETTTIRYAHAIAGSNHPATMLAPTMPAYGKKTADDGTVYHDPAIENIYNSAKGLQRARKQLAIDLIDNPKIRPNGVYGAGIFWWSSFILQSPDPRDGYQYAPDRQWWIDEWVKQN